MKNLIEFCPSVYVQFPKAIEENFLNIYQDIYVTQSDAIRQECLKEMLKVTEKSFRNLVKSKEKACDEVLIYYHSSPDFVIDIMRELLNIRKTNLEMEIISQDIAKRFLGVLFFFEPFLTLADCERVIKKNILLSLGDIIRLLGEARVSQYSFKIINVLKVAMEQTGMDLSEFCIRVWKILVKNCNISSLGTILSNIIVSLEAFVVKYPEEVNEIHKYLIIENSSLLSRNIADLFFIEQIQVESDIKARVLRQMESQKIRDEADVKTHISSLIRHLNSENSDLKIRVYGLQYMKTLFTKHRNELNKLICGQVEMDLLIEELLNILMNNFKNTSSEIIQLATAECLGELGAIEPSLQHQNCANQKEFPRSIHTDDFAIMALAELCRSFQLKHDARYIDALSMAIQELFKNRKVNSENYRDMDVWTSIPERMRPLVEPMLKTCYVPKLSEETEIRLIFWNVAQTPTDWALKWAGDLISKINCEETKNLLNGLKASMKSNQYTTSMFLPYIVLHNLESSDGATHHFVREEIQLVFDVMMGKDRFDRQKAKEKKQLFIKYLDFTPQDPKQKLLENDMKLVAIKVAKIIFEMFDFLDNYRRSAMFSITSKNIALLLDSFDLEEMAVVNYECGEYARAMIYMEEKMKKMTNVDEFQSKLSFLTNIYAKLGSPDSVKGIQALKTNEWSLAEKVLIGNVTRNYQDSAACFERMMQVGDAKFEHIQSMVNSYIALDQPETALLVYENMIQKLDTPHNPLNDEIKAEPLWRLSRFDELEQLLNDEAIQMSANWGVRCGQLLLKFRADDDEKFKDELCNTRLAIMKSLKISGSAETAYIKHYRDIINLHLITEFEKASNAVEEIKMKNSAQDANSTVKNLIDDWNKRLEFIQKNVSIEEPIFSFRRIVLNEARTKLQKIFNREQMEPLLNTINDEIGKLWIKSTKLARKHKMYQQAQIYILNAEAFEPKGLFIEKAKLNWIKGDQNNAFKILELGTNKINAEQLNKEDLEILSKGRLMIARYNAEAIMVDSDTNRKLFLNANVKGAENEKVFLLAAEYMDQYFSEEKPTEIARVGEPLKMLQVLKAYFRSMQCGNEFVFQSMPRYLSIWLDTTAQGYNKRHLVKEMTAINDAVAKGFNSLPISSFYTALSQIISRICHGSTDTFAVLKKILAKLVESYPQQSLWLLIPLLKSCHNKRILRCRDVLNDPSLKKPTYQVLIHNFNSLIEKFINLSTAPVHDKERNIRISTYVPELKHVLDKVKSLIIIPIESNLHQTRVCQQNSFKFPDNLVKILSIDDNVEVMRSLQKPRKVTIRGDNGKNYVILFKFKDDLRIDLRFFEFTSVVKEFLRKDAESRQRQLTAKTYSVIPLNEECGLIGKIKFIQR